MIFEQIEQNGVWLGAVWRGRELGHNDARIAEVMSVAFNRPFTPLDIMLVKEQHYASNRR